MTGLPGRGLRLREWVGTLLLGGAAATLLAWNIRFGLRAEHGNAVVLSSYATGRGGPTVASVEHRTAEGTVPARIEGWYWHPKNGEAFPTLYAPDRPHQPVLDQFFRRHCATLMAIVFFLVVATAEEVARRARRRSEEIDRRLAL